MGSSNGGLSMTLTIQDCMIEIYKNSEMCTGCFVKALSPLNYKCPICDKEDLA